MLTSTTGSLEDAVAVNGLTILIVKPREEESEMTRLEIEPRTIFVEWKESVYSQICDHVDRVCRQSGWKR